MVSANGGHSNGGGRGNGGGNSASKPSNGGTKPWTNKPSNGSTKPWTNKPGNGGNKPGNGSTKPSTNKPGNGDNKPGANHPSNVGTKHPQHKGGHFAHKHWRPRHPWSGYFAASHERSAEFGVEITNLYEGTAVRQGLHLGDVILNFNGTRTQSFADLAAAVQQSGSSAQVFYIDGDSGERRSLTLYPEDGRIGVAGDSVQVD